MSCQEFKAFVRYLHVEEFNGILYNRGPLLAKEDISVSAARTNKMLLTLIILILSKCVTGSYL